MLGHNKRLERKLKEHGGKQAWATVLESNKEWARTGGVNAAPGQAGSITVHQALRLRVEPDGEAPFEAAVKQVFNDSRGWQIPQEGWSVKVIYDPSDQSKVVIDLETMPGGPGVDRDEALARHEQALAWMQDPAAGRQQIEAMKADAAAKAQGAAALQETVTAAFASPQAGAAGATAVDQLTKLADLRDRGVLSDAQFEALKTKLIGTS